MEKIILPSTIGNTPLVKLPIRIKPHVNIYAKLESFNLTGSIKDRTGFYMFINALQKGRLDKNKIIIESSSGNTALSLAALSAIYGYKFTAYVGKNILPDREKLIRFYGANVIKTEIGKNVEIVRELIKKKSKKYQLLDQYSNNMNSKAHFFSTANEIIKDLPSVTHVVAGLGTGGTLMGLSERLKEYKKEIQIVAIEPQIDVYVPGLRNIRKFKPEIYNEDFIDKHLILKNNNISYKLVKKLSKKYGIPAGISSGAALWGALKIARQSQKGEIVVIFPDGIEKYMSLMS